MVAAGELLTAEPLGRLCSIDALDQVDQLDSVPALFAMVAVPIPFVEIEPIISVTAERTWSLPPFVERRVPQRNLSQVYRAFHPVKVNHGIHRLSWSSGPVENPPPYKGGEGFSTTLETAWEVFSTDFST